MSHIAIDGSGGRPGKLQIQMVAGPRNHSSLRSSWSRGRSCGQLARSLRLRLAAANPAPANPIPSVQVLSRHDFARGHLACRLSMHPDPGSQSSNRVAMRFWRSRSPRMNCWRVFTARSRSMDRGTRPANRHRRLRDRAGHARAADGPYCRPDLRASDALEGSRHDRHRAEQPREQEEIVGTGTGHGDGPGFAHPGRMSSNAATPSTDIVASGSSPPPVARSGGRSG
jgi:hypothetical protein